MSKNITFRGSKTQDHDRVPLDMLSVSPSSIKARQFPLLTVLYYMLFFITSYKFSCTCYGYSLADLYNNTSRNIAWWGKTHLKSFWYLEQIAVFDGERGEWVFSWMSGRSVHGWPNWDMIGGNVYCHNVPEHFYKICFTIKSFLRNEALILC